MPDVPSIQRWSPKQVKNAITKCLFDNENSFYAYMNRMAGDVQKFVENNRAEVITSYELLDDKPTIQGIPLENNMIDIFVDYKIQGVTPVVSDETPSEETNKIWFDTTTSDNKDELFKETQEEELTSISTFAFRNTRTPTTSTSKNYYGQLLLDVNAQELEASLVNEGEEVLSNEYQNLDVLEQVESNDILVVEEDDNTLLESDYDHNTVIVSEENADNNYILAE